MRYLKQLTLSIAAVLSIVSVLLFNNFWVYAEDLTITNNGSGSDNSISSGSQNNTTVSQSNDASVSNNATQTSNTGGNTAGDNTGGSTTTVTGDISTTTKAANTINNSIASVSGCCTTPTPNQTISGNGAGSTNNINVEQNSSVNVQSHQSANVSNNVSTTLNTGGSSSSGNTGGNTTVVTGRITTSTEIANRVNTSQVEVTCNCQTPVPTPSPTSTPTPSSTPSPAPTSTPTSGGDGGSSSSGSSSSSSSGGGGIGGPIAAVLAPAVGQVLGAAAGMLPATGGDWLDLILWVILLIALGLELALNAKFIAKGLKKLRIRVHRMRRLFYFKVRYPWKELLRF